jgi:hypothetical protein
MISRIAQDPGAGACLFVHRAYQPFETVSIVRPFFMSQALILVGSGTKFVEIAKKGLRWYVKRAFHADQSDYISFWPSFKDSQLRNRKHPIFSGIVHFLKAFYIMMLLYRDNAPWINGSPAAIAGVYNLWV